MKKIIIFLCFIMMTFDIVAAPDNKVAPELSRTQVAQENMQQDINLSIELKRVDNERFYVIMLVIMSLVSLFVSLYLLKNSIPTSKDIVVVTGLNFVVFGSIISTLIVSTSEQLGAVTGILGALGGYLFGTWSKDDKTKEQDA